jgi:acylpyruvate hydrolase
VHLGTLRIHGTTKAVVVDGTTATPIGDHADVGALLAQPDWRAQADAAAGASIEVGADADWAPVVPWPGKIVCVGLNYREHIEEMGRELPAHPTMFAKYPEALVGARDAIEVPPYASDAVDWEGELAVVIGSTARRMSSEEAEKAIAGYTVLNDVTMRDFQYRTPEWFQGKTFEHTAPLGPVLVTRDAFALGAEIVTTINGEVMQRAKTDDLVFSPADLVSYVSHIVTLSPGDIIATGTPGGVGHSLEPKRHLRAGDVVRTEVDGIGALENVVRIAA